MWLTDCFEFAEIAVDPKAQGQGIGGRLHDCLLADLSHRTAILSTSQEGTAALRLFRKRGWKTPRSDDVYPDGGRPCLLMGYVIKETR